MPTYIRSRRLVPSTAVRAAAAAAVAMPLALHAQPATPAADPKAGSLPAVTVKGAAESAAPIKADKLDSPKFTQPLLDTPQTVQVVNKELLQQQGAATLMDALRNAPGITMQLGEGGNTAAGDSFFMRGFAAATNVFQDGVRDLGPVTRDVFNLEQVEIVKGPAGADNGRGATGGYINLVSKKPQADDFIAGTVSVGSASVVRATADVNRELGDGMAVRINALAGNGEVPGRDEVHKRSQGIAPSFSFGLGTPTRVTLQTQHLRQHNLPDGGVTTIGLDGYYNVAFAAGGTAEGATVRKVDSSNFYGSREDYEDVESDMATVRIEHDLGRNLKLVNTTRFGRAKIDRRLTSVNAVSAPSTDPATWTVERRRHANVQSNDILANQTNLTAELKTGGLRHALSGGIEFSHERQSATTLAVPGATNNTIPASPVYDPDPTASVGAEPVPNGAYANGRITTAAAYLFDTIKLGPQWQVLAGLRHERYRAETNRADLVSNVLTHTAPSDSGSLTSWKLGVVYKPAANGSVYFAAANSYAPPGGSSLTLAAPTSTPGADRAGYNPQETENLELGTKWEFFEGKLVMTAAAYRSTNRNEVVQDPVTLLYGQDGERQVQGLELGVVGQITPKWQLSGGFATMDSEVTDTPAIDGNSQLGAVTRWTPKYSASLWTSYTLNDQWAFGGGARYLSRQDRVTDPDIDLGTQNMPSIPAYWVADLMASWAVHKNVTLQLNVQNLFDKAYIATLNNNGNRFQPGAPRTFTLAANLLF